MVANMATQPCCLHMKGGGGGGRPRRTAPTVTGWAVPVPILQPCPPDPNRELQFRPTVDPAPVRPGNSPVLRHPTAKNRCWLPREAKLWQTLSTAEPWAARTAADESLPAKCLTRGSGLGPVWAMPGGRLTISPPGEGADSHTGPQNDKILPAPLGHDCWSIGHQSARTGLVEKLASNPLRAVHSSSLAIKHLQPLHAAAGRFGGFATCCRTGF